MNITVAWDEPANEIVRMSGLSAAVAQFFSTGVQEQGIEWTNRYATYDDTINTEGMLDQLGRVSGQEHVLAATGYALYVPGYPLASGATRGFISVVSTVGRRHNPSLLVVSALQELLRQYDFVSSEWPQFHAVDSGRGYCGQEACLMGPLNLYAHASIIEQKYIVYGVQQRDMLFCTRCNERLAYLAL